MNSKTVLGSTDGNEDANEEGPEDAPEEGVEDAAGEAVADEGGHGAAAGGAGESLLYCRSLFGSPSRLIEQY